jgi:hypothetical protein
MNSQLGGTTDNHLFTNVKFVFFVNIYNMNYSIWSNAQQAQFEEFAQGIITRVQRILQDNDINSMEIFEERLELLQSMYSRLMRFYNIDFFSKTYSSAV